MSRSAFVLVIGLGSALACRVPDAQFTAGDGGSGSAIDAPGGSGSDAIDAGITPAATLSLLAGSIGGPGNLDGSGLNAHFGAVRRMAFGSNSTLYIADETNGTIRLVDATGVHTLSTSAGPVTFVDPQGIAVDATGNVYVADSGAKAVFLVAPGQDKVEFAGSGSAMFPFTFATPFGVALGSDNAVYVSDISSKHVVKISGGSATAFGAAIGAPDGIARGSDGFIYVVDAGDDVICRYNPVSGANTIIAGSNGAPGTANGSGTTARFDAPSDIALDPSGVLFVLDQSGNALRKVTVSAAGAGTTSTIAAGPLAPAFPALSVAAAPGTVAFGSTSELLEGSAFVPKVVAGSKPTTTPVDSSAGSAAFGVPRGLAVDADGDVYVTDRSAIFGGGTVRVVSGSDASVGTPSWNPPTFSIQRFTRPSGVALDGSGGLYVADAAENVIFLASLSSDDYIVEAGDGNGALEDGTPGELSGPVDVAYGSNGVVYVADAGNHAIRAITNGSASTLLLLTAASVPQGIAVGSDGVVYASFSDDTIRQVGSNSMTTTIGQLATPPFSKPQGLAVDAHGNLYVADQGNALIRKITPAGQVTTIVGVRGQHGIQLGSDARLAAPIGVAIRGTDLLVTDTTCVLVVEGVIQ